MMSQFHIAFALELLCLVSGTALLVLSTREKAFNKLTKWVGIVVMVLAVLSILCSVYTAACSKMGGTCGYSSSHSMGDGCCGTKKDSYRQMPKNHPPMDMMHEMMQRGHPGMGEGTGHGTTPKSSSQPTAPKQTQ